METGIIIQGYESQEETSNDRTSYRSPQVLSLDGLMPIKGDLMVIPPISYRQRCQGTRKKASTPQKKRRKTEAEEDKEGFIGKIIQKTTNTIKNVLLLVFLLIIIDCYCTWQSL